MVIDTNEVKNLIWDTELKAYNKMTTEEGKEIINIFCQLLIQEVEDYENKEMENMALDKGQDI